MQASSRVAWEILLSLYLLKRSGTADLPLHYGKVPPWLAQRMSRLGLAIVESLVLEYGKKEVIRRLSDPAWFQALGCVMGMDWHSSGITTSVLGCLKTAVNPRAKELGIYFCGGRGKNSRQTPDELINLSEKTGLNGDELVRSSRLTAKVDNNAIQDGYQLYLHSFILTDEGDWTVVQQGMNTDNRTARRYHWHSANIRSFVEEPHTSIYGPNQGTILNLTDKQAGLTRQSLLKICSEEENGMLTEARKIILPMHHDVRKTDVDIKRLGAILAAAKEESLPDFESLLLLKGLGPRTLQSLTLVSEVIHGTPSRFTDPARFSFAHGGKDGHPFPVPVKVYDQTLSTLETAITKAKLGDKEKQESIRKLHDTAKRMEQDFEPAKNLDKFIDQERKDSWKYGGRTVFGKAKPPSGQMKLF